MRGGPRKAVVFALVRVVHLRSEDIVPERLRRLVRLMPRDVLLADGVQLFLNHEVRLVLALGRGPCPPTVASFAIYFRTKIDRAVGAGSAWRPAAYASGRAATAPSLS